MGRQDKEGQVTLDGEVEKTNLDSAKKLVFVHEKVVARSEGKFCFPLFQKNPDASNEKTLNHAHSLSLYLSLRRKSLCIWVAWKIGEKSCRDLVQKTKNATKTHIHLEASRIQHVWQDFQFEFYSQRLKKDQGEVAPQDVLQTAKKPWVVFFFAWRTSFLGSICGSSWRSRLFSPTAECYGVLAQYRFWCVLGELGRFREGTWFQGPVPGSVSGKPGCGPEALFRVQKVASPKFRRFRCLMGSEGLGSVPEVWTELVLGTGFREPEVLRCIKKVPGQGSESYSVLWRYTGVLWKYAFVRWKYAFVLWKYHFVL